MTTTKQATRRARLDAIADGARVREALGQGARHWRGADGRHVVALFDRRAGELRMFSGAMLAAAIGRAERGRVA